MTNTKSLSSVLHYGAVLATTLAIGCAGVDSTSSEQFEAKKEKRTNTNEVLVASLGASTSAGVLVDPELLGQEPGMVFANPNHLDQFADVIAASGQEVDAYNLAVPGATTSDILADQLPELLEELSRYSLPAVVTIEGGGNDLRAFQQEHIASCMSDQLPDLMSCMYNLTVTIQTAAANIDFAISAIREVAPDTTIILQTQPNSLYGNSPIGPCADAQMRGIADLALEGDPTREPPAEADPVMGLNVALRALATAQGVQVADAAGYLYATGEFSDPSYFSYDCTHLSPKGYQLLLGTFVGAL